MFSPGLRIVRLLAFVTCVVLCASLMPPTQNSLAARQGRIEITLRGCPEGVDPTVISNPRRECDVPLDAPDNAFIYYGGDGQGGEEVRFLDRKYDGTYVTSIPANRTVDLIGFEPTVRDSYAMTGVRDRNDDGNFDVQVRPGRTARVRVYYYNASSGGGSGSATITLTMRACPDDVNPNYTDPWEVCTIPLDAPDDSLLVWDQEGGVSIPGLPRQNDGTYVFETPPGILEVEILFLEPVLRNSYIISGTSYGNGQDWGISLRPGEVRDIWVFYYF